MRRSFARIYLSHLIKNFEIIRTTAPRSSVFAVVKADAYGHGMLPVVRALETLGSRAPEAYAVAYAEEGVELRNGGITKPILVFEGPNIYNCEMLAAYSLTPSIYSTEHLRLLANPKTRPFPVHLKVDTGMNRLGIKPFELEKFFLVYTAQEKVRITGAYTHFAESDNEDTAFTRSQIAAFSAAADIIRNFTADVETFHAANSGAIFHHPDSHLDAVRPGISLYGYEPSYSRENKFELLPVMEVNSIIESIKFLEPGETVSYSRTYGARKKTRIASIPIGYADGVSRLLSNQIRVIVNDTFIPQRGIITMDRILIEIGDAEVKTGDEVILLGTRGDKSITAWDWCRISGSIPYEVTCSMTKRLKRDYLI